MCRTEEEKRKCHQSDNLVLLYVLVSLLLAAWPIITI